jgi:hypothetical protein
MSETNGITNAPWITPEGSFDPTKLPIDWNLRQGVSGDFGELPNSCSVFAMMVSHG